MNGWIVGSAIFEGGFPPSDIFSAFIAKPDPVMERVDGFLLFFPGHPISKAGFFIETFPISFLPAGTALVMLGEILVHSGLKVLTILTETRSFLTNELQALRGGSGSGSNR